MPLHDLKFLRLHFSWHYELKPQLLTTERRSRIQFYAAFNEISRIPILRTKSLVRSFLSFLPSAHLICKTVIFDYDGKKSFFFCFLGRKHSDQVKCRYNHERRSTVSKEGRRRIKKVSFSLQFNFVLVISTLCCVC